MPNNKMLNRSPRFSVIIYLHVSNGLHISIMKCIIVSIPIHISAHSSLLKTGCDIITRRILFTARQDGREQREEGTSAYEFIKGAIDEGTAGSHGAMSNRDLR